ncbi:hypothetical protein [Mesorhizobium sp. L103C105A0]|uniref:hypothetical protein n=1 Tax=Mesorhizobium sp. L103C105A0 TaxID=1287074 RepID=UPI001FDA4F84|nr:hypothetical protein [Mesorhizobium sp. L103C105A0]
MDNVVPFRKAVPCVEVTETCGEWFVRVVEKDQEIARSFNQDRSRCPLQKASGYA